MTFNFIQMMTFALLLAAEIVQTVAWALTGRIHGLMGIAFCAALIYMFAFLFALSRRRWKRERQRCNLGK